MNRASTGKGNSQSESLSRLSHRLLGRLLLFACVLGPEILLLAGTPHAYTLFGPFAPLGIVSYAVFIGLGYSHFKSQKEDLPFNVGYFLAHLGCVLAVSIANIAALHGFSFYVPEAGVRLILRVILVVGIALLALACIPGKVWLNTFRQTKLLWLYSLFTGALAWCLRFPLQSFWDSSSTAPGRFLQVLTFHAVKAVLRVFLPNIYVDSDTFIIGTSNFSIFVAEACSGLEGIGLVLAFTVIWLWYFRKESRFPQAILLVPFALVSVWLLNILRISALVLIGNAGYGEIAMVGFHSQAGWIAFTTIAFAFSMATRKLRWVRRHYYMSPEVLSADGSILVKPAIVEVEADSGESPATGAYLVPFLAILGATFLSKAASGHFEWLYPVRFLAAAVAIWRYWPELKQINWRFGWLAPVTGTAVFLVWLAPSVWSHSTETSLLGTALNSLSPLARWSWIAFRVAAAVVTVPVAEELAFRGYLARRLINREFDTIPFSAVTLLSIGLSSAVFGFMHGQQWIVGILAGLAYAGVMKWKGRLGDAIVAHATTNFLLAVWVLTRGDWSQW